ncbi:hypothetical protein B2G71_12615 [Novosphingobium sp. PC22D]|uniref:TIGR03619 family F420-dependent LLM class oxidoreductase n=1 Tax=Novosphingobium sp. PC22D TaxID=1962403 RepID=UPI000BFAF69A|nr:TIGR03619 family F420-dependent LLM class oxidoreductase [Novosphingobium sp. PC22D]PEQ12334.1 hypothetical protein B2G71_12615 [Novosphingobium sp. PC22D]
MQFALNLPLARFLPAPDPGAVIDRLATAFEQAGIDAALMSEHPAPSAEWIRTDPAAHHSLDPLMALGMVAARSKRLRVFTNILVLPYRNPLLLAKMAGTLQILSDGRLMLGVGTGYMKEEFEALGVDPRERGALTDEAIETLREAWSGEPVVRKGRHFNAVGNDMRPVPATPPPIWVGGGSDKALERAAKLGDGWAPYFTVPTNDPVVRRSAVVSMEHFAQKVEQLHAMRADLGRGGGFDLSVAPPFRPKVADRPSAEQFREEVEQLRAHGVTWIWTSLPATSVEQYADIVAWFGEEIVAPLRTGWVAA